jgi:hypothetical protein
MDRSEKENKSNRIIVFVKWALPIMISLAIVYVPGIWLGTVGAGPYSNKLEDPITFIVTIFMLGSLFALIGFTIGCVIGVIISLPITMLFVIIFKPAEIDDPLISQIPYKTIMVISILIGVLMASMGVLLSVRSYAIW